MFSVLIEAQPREGQWDAYFANAATLQPELEQAPGFIEDVRYRSLSRDGWILSLSLWSDEEAVIGWHMRMPGEERKEKDWRPLLADYRLRVGEVISDSRPPQDQQVAAFAAGAGGAGEGDYLTLIEAKQTAEWVRANNPQEAALYLGFDLYSYGDCISWDIFDSLSNPGEIILVVTWKDAQSASDHAATQIVPDDARVRVVRVARDDMKFGPEQTSSDQPAASGATIGA
jgi:heme-degrading monooxygenase HmoA